MKIKTFLPLFPGFYETIFQLNTEDFESENGVDFDDLEIDYKEYEKDVVNDFAGIIESNCPFIKSVKVEEIISPKYYNYSNDSVNVEIDVNCNQLAKYMRENREKLAGYIKKRYSPGPGFIPYYSDDVSDWEIETKGFRSLAKNGHYLGALLDFYFYNESFDYWIAYDLLEVYPDSYIEINIKKVSDLYDFELSDVAEKVIDDVEIWGYLELLANECKKQCEVFPFMEWGQLLCEKHPKEVLQAAGVEKVKKDLTPIIKAYEKHL
jgi:hypothetical protein